MQLHRIAGHRLSFEGRFCAAMKRLVRGVRQCSIYVVHIVGLGRRSTLSAGGSLLQDHAEGWLLGLLPHAEQQ